VEIKERQRDIIEAAGALLTRSGLSGLTIKNLAAEMQFSESALYRHFTSKEEIILAMLKYLAADMDKRLADAVQGVDDPLLGFKNIFESQFRFFSQNKHFVVAVFSDCLMEESVRINETILNLIAIKRRHLLPIIVAGQQKGVFTDSIVPEHLMHITIGNLRLKMFKWKEANFEFNIEARGKDLINSLHSIILKNK